MARFKAAVPAAWLLKLKTRVSQAEATVVRASVSTLMVGSLDASTFRRIGVPAVGDHTLTLMLVAPTAKGIGAAKPTVPPTVVPAQSSAIAVFMVLTTWLVALVGSTTISDEFPPKSVRP